MNTKPNSKASKVGNISLVKFNLDILNIEG